MCYNCGCQNPDDDMGSPDNITNSTLNHLSKHWDKSFDETRLILLQALENQDQKILEEVHIKEMFGKAAKAWGQSVDQAKSNTLELLKNEEKSLVDSSSK